MEHRYNTHSRSRAVSGSDRSFCFDRCSSTRIQTLGFRGFVELGVRVQGPGLGLGRGSGLGVRVRVRCKGLKLGSGLGFRVLCEWLYICLV